jgi:3-oxoacyl-[acyl-carrier protein] reductase
MSGLLQGRCALVTGAGSGIGAATARLLAEHGAVVALGYHNDSTGAEAVCAALPNAGHFVLQLKIDDPASLEAGFARVAADFGRLDILVNSAGASRRVPLADLDALDDATFKQITDVNLAAPFAVIRRFRPLLDKSDAAAVVNISSLAASTGVGSNHAYAASKGGLNTLTMGLARILAPRIRVFSVSPAGVDTDFLKGRNPAVLTDGAKTVPLAKVTGPDDVALAVLACAALLTSSTGIDIVVDEGRHLVGWPL